MLLSLASVAKVYGTRVIFKGVSLEVAPGTVTLLTGANGAGKSTLMRIMAGLARPSGGAVQCRVPEARLGYLGHATFVYPALTAWENLRFWGDVYGLGGGSAAVDAVLERVELRPHAHERAGVFSRGMAQRLNLARVLLLEPQLLLLDEPGTGLDTRSAGLLRREIALARQRGAGVVWISHDLAGDAALADRVILLERGRVAYDGPAADFAARAAQAASVGDMAGAASGDSPGTPDTPDAMAATAPGVEAQPC